MTGSAPRQLVSARRYLLLVRAGFTILALGAIGQLVIGQTYHGQPATGWFKTVGWTVDGLVIAFALVVWLSEPAVGSARRVGR